METDQQTKTILLFAYGTLRTGERLHDWIENEIIEPLGLATLSRARLFYGREHTSYPYLVFTDSGQDKAVGEVFRLPLSDTVIQMFQMEVNAGYRINECEVELADGTMVDAAVCSWFHQHGDAIPNNDWRGEERMKWWR
jgi:gamma-glutamylcyclotransferase (GGCT)/AIG2-like uncharacterized protein YtfP